MRGGVLSVVLFISLFPGNVLAQLNKQKEDSIAKREEKADEKFHSVIWGADYSTNTNTFGKFNSFVRQPSFAPSLSFYHKSGLFIHGLLNIIGKSDSSATHSTYQVDLKGGCVLNLSDKFSITPSYTHYIYDEKALTISTLYRNYAEVNADMETKYWVGTVSAGYLWGRIDEFSIDARTGVTYTWENAFFKKDAFVVQFFISGFFNNPNYLSSLFDFLNDYADANPENTRKELLQDLFTISDRSAEIKAIRRIFQTDPTLRKLVRAYLSPKISIKDFLHYNNRFTLTSLGCSIPISYVIGNFAFNIDFSIYRTMNQPVYAEQDYYSYMTAGLSYSLNWK